MNCEGLHEYAGRQPTDHPMGGATGPADRAYDALHPDCIVSAPESTLCRLSRAALGLHERALHGDAPRLSQRDRLRGDGRRAHEADVG